MKKVTIINSNLGYGGIEQFLSSFCNMLKGEYEVEMFVVYKKYDKPAISLPNTVKIKYIFEYEAYPSSVFKYLFRLQFGKAFNEGLRGLNILLNWKRNLIKIVKNLNSDYVVTTRLKETTIVNKYCSKHVIKIHTEHNYPTTLYRAKLIDSTSNYQKLVVVNDEIKNLYLPFFKRECYSIPNCLKYIPIKKSKLNSLNLVTIGRFEKEKGYLDLIDIVKIIKEKIPNIKLYLIGDGSLNKIIRNKIILEKLNDNIILTGYLNFKERENYLIKSSIYVLTSYTESFGLALLEAMSYGLPAIAFSTSGSDNLLKNDIGIIIKKRDNNIFATEVIELISNSKKLKEYSQRSMTKSMQFTEDRIKDKWLEVFK